MSPQSHCKTAAKITKDKLFYFQAPLIFYFTMSKPIQVTPLSHGKHNNNFSECQFLTQLLLTGTKSPTQFGSLSKSSSTDKEAIRVYFIPDQIGNLLEVF